MKPFGKSRRLFSFLVRSLIFSLLIFCATDLSFAIAGIQVPDFYYYYTEKIYLPLSTEILSICFEDDVTKEQKEAIIRDDPVLEQIEDENLPSGLVIVKVVEGLDKTDIVESIERLNTLQQVRYSSPIFQYHDMKMVLMDEFIVRFKADTSENDIRIINRENGVEIVSKSPYRHNRYVLRVGNAKVKNVIAVANLYNENPKIKYAAPDFLVIGAYCNTYPNDTYFLSQWGLNNTGQSPPGPPGGTEDADMDAPEGWDISTGSSDIVIAIIDTGVDIDHEDLSEKIWVNEAEIDGNEGFDDDNNGYIDDFYGWDFENGDNDPRPDLDPNTDNAHGTSCAGLAAAQSFNGKGIAGVCWGAKIMPLRIGAGGVIASAAAEGIDYARHNGADVLSNSWKYLPHPDITDAIIQAKNNGRNGKGCVIVFASGNNYGAVEYPAWLSETIAVGATDQRDMKWEYSGYGDSLDIVAPSASGDKSSGVFFWTTDISGIEFGYNKGPIKTPDAGDDAGNYFKWFGGTSAATPQVAGFAGLILSGDNTLTSEEVRWLMRNSADDKGDVGWDIYYGAGRINVYQALNGMINIPNKATSPFPTIGATGLSVNVDLSWKAATGTLSHDVYFGTDYDSVLNANTSSQEFRGNQPQNTFEQGALQPNTTYYWRIDERNKQGVTAGDVWHFTTGASSGVFYVDDNAEPDGDGRSWLTAFNDLQDALAVAWSGDEIWVEEGIYKPTDGSNRSISFELVKGVGVYGGFAGTETSLDQRDWSNHQTILSGDIETIGNPADNSYHVVKGASSAILDGFIITKGNANGFSDDGRGGGMFNFGAMVTVSHCTFKDNNANLGGGMFNRGYSPIVKNCILNGNTATNGGGIYNYQSYSIVKNCTLGKNTATVYGGGMFNWGSYPIATNCILWGNSASSGYEIYNIFFSSPTFRYCDIKEGWPGEGNINEDPLFVNADAGDYHLQGGSPCINVGDPDYQPEEGETDIDGDRRKMGVRVDMGADEADCLIGGVAHDYEHADWVAWGKPDCWCYARECRGDINGLKTGPYWVQSLDLQLLNAAYNKTDSQLAAIPNGICADLNHKKTGPSRVQLLDLNILNEYFNKPEAQVPVCDQEPVTTGPYNFWTN